MVGVIAGGLLGSFAPETGVAIGFLGQIFLNALKMIVLPLIVVSITLSIIRLGDVRSFGSIGVKTLAYYTVTTALAVLTGIVVVLVLRPGAGVEALGGGMPVTVKGKGAVSIADIAMSFFPSNLVEAAAKFNILPLIVASVLFGLAFATLGRENKVIEDLFSATDKAIMKIVGWVLYLAPIGIMAIIAERIGREGGGATVAGLVMQIGKYFLAVIVGLSIHALISLPIVLYAFSRRNPVRHFATFGKALLMAFSTASSSATLPLTISCAEENGRLPKKVTRFVLPLGATVNMDGTALYEAVAAIFIAESYGIHLSMEQLIIIFLTATIAAIGAAGIPEAGLITMVLVLKAVGLPLEGIGLILTVDWLLDRFRTTVNVWGDSVGAAVVTRWSGFGGEDP